MAKSLTFEWDAPAHEHKIRSADWLWAAGIIVVGLALVAIIFGNIIFSILILVSAFALGIHINREPHLIHVKVRNEGLLCGRIFYPMETLESFWIDVEHPHNKILIRSKKRLMPLIVIPLSSEVDVDRLEDALAQHLPVEYHSLPFLEMILEYLGF